MLKYVDTLITFSEIPKEVALCINFALVKDLEKQTISLVPLHT